MSFKLDTTTDVPGPLKPFYSDLAEFKAEVAIYAENSHRNDCLMAKMLTMMTFAEAEATKAEIRDIAVKMNELMAKRLGTKKTVEAMVGVLLLGEYIMANAQKSPLTIDQLAMLHGTGAYSELLKGGK